MVQYVFTPWRDRQELILVRDQFYQPSSAAAGDAAAHSRAMSRRSQPHVLAGRATSAGEQGGEDDDAESEHVSQKRRRNSHEAVARVGMWMQRGNCPHIVESTALLVAAVLSDEESTASAAGRRGSSGMAASMYAVRAAYSAAFSRFVTGLLDGHQDKQRKQSMYSIAKTIGLPATFVELRHQSTHEQLPSIAKLRSAADKALEWIWDYYWKHLQADDLARGTQADPLTQAAMKYLREDNETKQRVLVAEICAIDATGLDAERTIKELQTTLPGNQAYIKCAKLRDEVKTLRAERALTLKTEEQGALKAAQEQAVDEEEEDDESDCGWVQYRGIWKPKPIGIV